MGLNRYDTISTSTYDPRSLQETLMVPMMKRQQHDEANKQLYAQLGELDKINPLDKHYNEAQKIKAELSGRINSQAQKLATEGFNTNTTADLFKANNDIKSLYAPTGKIGQINAAKEAYDKESAEYLKNSTALGHSPEVVQKHLKEIQEKYNASAIYDSKGKVINMTVDALPPKYIDHITRAREFFKDAGMNSNDIDNLSSSIETDSKGQYVLSKGHKEGHASNKVTLQRAVDFLNHEINNPNSDVGKSLKYGYKTPQEAIEDIKMMSPIYKSTKTSVGDSSQISNFTPNKVDDEGKDKGEIISNDSALTSDALEQNTYSDALNEIKKIRSNKTVSKAEKSRLDDLVELRRNADAKLNKNPLYLKAKKEYDSAVKWLNTKNYPQNRGAEGELAIRQAGVNRRLSILNDIKNKTWKESSSLRHNYAYLPSNPKEESAWNLHNENVFNTLKGIPNLGNVLDLTSINTSDGTKKNLIDSDVQNAKSLLNGADPKTFKISNVKTYGDGRTPEVTVTFNTGKNAEEFNMDRGLFSAGRTSKFGGSEQPITLTFKLKKFSNAAVTGSAPGYKNLAGAIGGFWKNKGGLNNITGNYKGQEVYTSMVKNAYADLSNAELANMYNSDEDARTALNIRAAQKGVKPSDLVTKYGKDKN